MNKLEVAGFKSEIIDNNRVDSQKMKKMGYSVFLSLYRNISYLITRFAETPARRAQSSDHPVTRSASYLRKKGAAHLPGGSRLSSRLLVRLFVGLLVTGYCLLSTLSLSHAKYSGGQPGTFLSWGAGARSLAMGRAFIAVSDDASATYWNPAAMSQMVRKELIGLNVKLWEDTDYNFLSYVHPTAKFGVFGINYATLRSGGFIRAPWDKMNETGWYQKVLTSGYGQFENKEDAVTIAYGKKVLENFVQNLSGGVSAKFIDRQLDASKDSHFSFDLALFMENLNSYPVSIGFKLQNLLTFHSGDTNDILPLTFRFGAAYKTLRDRMILAFDFDKMVTANLGWHIGAEYWLLDFAAVRMGFEGQASEMNESTVGLGLKYKNYGFDYAFALHELGASHRFSGTFRFGASVVTKWEEAVRRLQQEGLEAYRQGEYTLSMERLNRLLDLDPRNREAKKIASKLETIISIIPKVVETTRDAELTRRGIAAYVEGDPQTAVNVLRYAYSLQPENEAVRKILNRAEQESSEKLTEPEGANVPTAAFSYLDQKLYRALEYIYAKQYDKAVLECQEVLNLEPNNVIAMERMGSALFLMNQRELARKVWMKALEIDPNNAVVREALGRLK